MKLSKLVDPQFQSTLRKLAGQEVPLKTAFALKGIIKRANEELVKYEEVRTSAVQRFGDKKEDGTLETNESGNVKLNDENAAAFVAELTSLLSTEVDIGAIKAQDLGDKITLTTSELMSIDELITD